MSEDNSTSFINLGDLSKPANTLIEKVSSAVGGLFAPWQIKRVAKAKAEAYLIDEKNQIEISDLHRRAMHRFVEEEAKRQQNMEEITKKSLAYLNEDSKPDQMEDDWITNFFDKSRIISDDDMQKLWSQVLAGEANSPGSFSKRTVNLLSDLDKKDAELFQTLCRFVWNFGDNQPLVPFVYDMSEEIYNKHGIDFESLTHLDSLGLISFHGLAGFLLNGLPKNLTAKYYDQKLSLILPKESENEIGIGSVILSQTGKELAKIALTVPVDDFFDSVRVKWIEFLPNQKA
ncbi:hypothetical protein V6x_37460 [Gimesia chilikensis]|uniref:DUF2806 domain-containing protein n=1 Tax=Gimesia chilikensis TaxID=2605989 RepID=A0A517WFJ5_9PLAN|nr:DUF2806 domain-containing protein [Gimesia chilikensis]QDU04021.1 hypothetical protein V6x_37460 [Gimesia chilikensis]